MHIEVLVEDSSGEKLLTQLLPKILGNQGEPHTWRLKAYKGIGRIPQGLTAKADPAKRILLDQLPRLLQGYGKTLGIDAVVVSRRTLGNQRHCRGCQGLSASEIPQSVAKVRFETRGPNSLRAASCSQQRTNHIDVLQR